MGRSVPTSQPGATGLPCVSCRLLGYRLVARYWTVDEARAALPRVRELVRRIMGAVGSTALAETNGHTPDNADVQAAMAELAADDIVLRDPSVGLIDFPARGADGIVYLLCWRADEDDLGWWHLPEDGFAGRQPLPRDPE